MSPLLNFSIARVHAFHRGSFPRFITATPPTIVLIPASVRTCELPPSPPFTVDRALTSRPRPVSPKPSARSPPIPATIPRPPRQIPPPPGARTHATARGFQPTRDPVHLGVLQSAFFFRANLTATPPSVTPPQPTPGLRLARTRDRRAFPSPLVRQLDAQVLKLESPPQPRGRGRLCSDQRTVAVAVRRDSPSVGVSPPTKRARCTSGIA